MTSARGESALRFATFLAPNMLPVYRFLAERISDRLGRPVELVVGTSFDQFEQGEADLGVICGLPYVWLADRHPARPSNRWPSRSWSAPATAAAPSTAGEPHRLQARGEHLQRHPGLLADLPVGRCRPRRPAPVGGGLHERQRQPPRPDGRAIASSGRPARSHAWTRRTRSTSPAWNGPATSRTRMPRSTSRWTSATVVPARSASAVAESPSIPCRQACYRRARSMRCMTPRVRLGRAPVPPVAVRAGRG